MYRIMIFVGAIFWATTAAAQTPKPAEMKGVTAALLNDIRIASSLKDPRSAQFERLQRAIRPNRKGEPHEVVCGFVNAKNGFGAYTGFRPFVYLVADKKLYFSSGDTVDNMIAKMMLDTFCTGLI